MAPQHAEENPRSCVLSFRLPKITKVWFVLAQIFNALLGNFQKLQSNDGILAYHLRYYISFSSNNLVSRLSLNIPAICGGGPLWSPWSHLSAPDIVRDNWKEPACLKSIVAKVNFNYGFASNSKTFSNSMVEIAKVKCCV